MILLTERISTKKISSKNFGGNPVKWGAKGAFFHLLADFASEIRRSPQTAQFQCKVSHFFSLGDAQCSTVPLLALSFDSTLKPRIAGATRPLTAWLLPASKHLAKSRHTPVHRSGPKGCAPALSVMDIIGIGALTSPKKGFFGSTPGTRSTGGTPCTAVLPWQAKT